VNTTLWGYVAIGAILLVWVLRVWWHKEPEWKRTRDVLAQIATTGSSPSFEDYLYIHHPVRTIDRFRKRAREIAEQYPEGENRVSAEGRAALAKLVTEMDRTFGAEETKS
jgi:hypothetical protein